MFPEKESGETSRFDREPIVSSTSNMAMSILLCFMTSFVCV